MPFIASVSARQSGLLFANAAKLLTPLFSSPTATAGGFTFSISNYDSNATYSFPATYEIGDTGPAGGKIFITPTTAGNTTGKYFEAAAITNSDAMVNWATEVNSNLTTSTGATGTAIGTGEQNTIAIVAQTGNIAASSAGVYASEFTFNGYSDWFLPSKDELNQLYIQRDSVGGFANDLYWSSSEFSSGRAWRQDFPSGGQANSLKPPNFRVRPVRSFLLTSATQSSGLVTVTGLGSAVSATVTVNVNKNGWLANSSSTTGTSLTQYTTEFTLLGGGGSEAGGAGAMANGSYRFYGGNSYTVTVGAGGTGNGKGNQSVLGILEAAPGGGRDQGGGGSSQGGNTAFNYSDISGGDIVGTVVFHANSGGAYGSGADYNVGHAGIGGGGGAGGNGSAGSAEQGGNGGAGRADILGTVRGGGGGGHSHRNGGGTSKPSGGSGGGGAGTNYNFGCDTSSAGAANYGAGGGSNWGECGGSNAGGSGIVIIRYTGPTLASIGAGLVYSLSSSGSIRTYTFTGGTGTITF
jgi:hypothetical protein